MTGQEDKSLPYDLENMSIPELEALLQQDFLASDGGTPDVDYIMAIVEVIQKKEQTRPGYQPLDTAKAWEEFKTSRPGEEANSAGRSGTPDGESLSPSKPAEQTLKSKRTRMLRRCLAAAASLCCLIALTCVPVFGFGSIVQMVACWTAEQFGFYLPSQGHSSSAQIPKEYEELQDIMQQLGAELTIPQFPEGFEAKQPMLSYYPDNNTLQFMILYQLEEDYFIYGINQDGDKISNLYEKDDFLVETKLYNGNKHYFLENEDNHTVAWFVGTIEHHIITNMSISDLKEILELMYEV